MVRTALDTSVVVAALLSWHEHHEAALPLVQAALAERDGPILPLPALLESYSVLTRLPPPSRLAPEDALLMANSWLGGRGVAGW